VPAGNIKLALPNKRGNGPQKAQKQTQKAQKKLV
jgi:hypothetical protein